MLFRRFITIVCALFVNVFPVAVVAATLSDAPLPSSIRVIQVGKTSSVVGLTDSASFNDPLLEDLLKVRIDVSQKGWNVFDVHADVNRNNETSVTWAFGDGSSARGMDSRHTYMTAGKYVVSVVATSPDGERAQEKLVLDISFWHLSNWQLWVLFFGLGCFMGLLLMLARTRGDVRGELDTEEDSESPLIPFANTKEDLFEQPASLMKKKKIKKRRRPTKKRIAEQPKKEVVLPL